jgi:hypothetical protein
VVSIERIQSEVGSIFCFRRANRLAPGHPDYPVQMAILGAIYVGIATTVHMAIVLLAARALGCCKDAPEYDPANSGVGPRCCGAWLIWATRR